MKRFKRETFTLAEVLITLAIVGVVAALTIPTLINRISQIVNKAKTEVIEKRLLDGLNRARTGEDILTQSYENTEEFLKKLNIYYKMVSICGADNIGDCFSNEKILLSNGNTLETANIKTAEDFALDSEIWHSPAAFISAQGTPFIFALKKTCTDDPDMSIRGLNNECFAFLYDNNGPSSPNVQGNDVKTYGLNFPLITVNGIKIMEKSFFPVDLGNLDYNCETEKTKGYGITRCSYADDNDQFGRAMYYCKSKGWHLATYAELENILAYLYVDSQGRHPNDIYWSSGYDGYYHLDTTLTDKIFTTNNGSYYVISGNEERDWSNYAQSYGFNANRASRDIYRRDRTDGQGLCVQ